MEGENRLVTNNGHHIIFIKVCEEKRPSYKKCISTKFDFYFMILNKIGYTVVAYKDLFLLTDFRK